MSGKVSPEQYARIKQEAVADLLKMIIPQAFSSGQIIDGEKGGIDEWKLSRINGRALLSLIYFQHRGEHDHVRFYKEFVDRFMRGSKSIEGYGLKMMENIAIGISGGGASRKLVKKPGWVGRNITNKKWREKADRENARVVE